MIITVLTQNLLLSKYVARFVEIGYRLREGTDIRYDTQAFMPDGKHQKVAES